MRLRLGRPAIKQFADRFDVPPADADTPLTVTWLGVTTLLIDDGATALMTDGFFSRPSMRVVSLQRLAPSQQRITDCLRRLGVHQLEAVVAVHTHFDHALDSAVVAARTGARLVGGESAANIGRGYRLAANRMVLATPGQAIRFGSYEVTLLESRHSQPDRYPGVITSPVVPPARAKAYRCGEAWSTLVHHVPTGQRLLIQGSAGYVCGALSGHTAEVVYLGVGQLGVLPESYIAEYWDQTVRAVGARRVVLIHWDDFFHPLDQPMRALPYALDDLGTTMAVLGRLAAADRVALHLPTVWQRANPWA